MMNGTYDPIVPMFGRPTPGARLMSATDSANLFARINGCGDPVQEPAKNARIVRWNDCAGGSAVAFYQVEGGHQPPPPRSAASTCWPRCCSARDDAGSMHRRRSGPSSAASAPGRKKIPGRKRMA